MIRVEIQEVPYGIDVYEKCHEPLQDCTLLFIKLVLDDGWLKIVGSYTYKPPVGRGPAVEELVFEGDCCTVPQ